MNGNDGDPTTAIRTGQRGRLASMVVICTALCGCGNTGEHASAGAEGYVGSRWNLTSVQQAGGQAVEVPSALNARVEFSPTGDILAWDGVNALFGRFSRTSDGFETTDLTMGAATYAGSDPTRLLIIRAIDAIGPATDGSSGPKVRVRAEAAADGLHLAVKGYELDFRRGGPAADMSVHSTPPAS